MILRLLLKRAPKKITILMWIPFWLRLALPLFFESAISPIPSTENLPERIILSAAPELETRIPESAGVAPAFSGPFISEVSASPARIALMIACAVWAAGTAAMALYALIGYVRLRMTVRESVLCADGTYMCDRVNTPFILGLVRPRVFLPSSIDQKDAVFAVAHEKAHIKRLDHVWKPLGFALLSVHWFNPVCWAAYVLFCRDIELACDEKVICDIGPGKTKQYVNALINCSAQNRAISACPLAFGESMIKKRIRSLMEQKKPALIITVAAAVCCVVLAAVFLTNQPNVKNDLPVLPVSESSGEKDTPSVTGNKTHSDTNEDPDDGIPRLTLRYYGGWSGKLSCFTVPTGSYGADDSEIDPDYGEYPVLYPSYKSSIDTSCVTMTFDSTPAFVQIRCTGTDRSSLSETNEIVFSEELPFSVYDLGYGPEKRFRAREGDHLYEVTAHINGAVVRYFFRIVLFIPEFEFPDPKSKN